MNRTTTAAVFLAFWLFLDGASVEAVQIPFDGANEIGAEDGPVAAVVVDWNLDGRQDILVASSTGDRLRRFSNETFGWLEQSLGTFVDGPSALAAGDADRDGTPDLLYAGNAGGEIRLILNRASNLIVSLDASIDAPNGVALGDLDGDGDLDAVATSFGAGQVYWYTNVDGDGESWTRILVANAGDSPRDVIPADIDQDGDLDLVVVTQARVLWYENRLVDGISWAEHVIDASFLNGWTAAVGDLDRDGDLDVVCGAINSNQLARWTNDGTPATGAWTKTAIESVPTFDVELADMDQDGDLDVVTGRWGSAPTGGARWYENLTSPAPWTSRLITDGYDTPLGIALGDLDGDGDTDVVLAGGESDSIASVENLGHHRRARYDTSYTLAPPASADIVASAYGDFDLDGFFEILTFEIDQRLYLRQSSSGSKTLISVLSQDLIDPRAFRVGDMDNDGDLDVVVAMAVGVEWLENPGTSGGWSRHTVSSRDSIVALWLADVNNDSLLDVVGVDSDPQEVRWWRQPTAGSWFDNFVTSYTTFHDLAVADVDLDGGQEIVVAQDTTIEVLQRLADAVWDHETVGSATTTALALGDLDQDGDLDIAVSHTSGPSNNPIRVFRNNRTLGWDSPVPSAGTIALTSLAAVDIDDDGDIDLAGGAAGSQAVLATNPGDGSLTLTLETLVISGELIEPIDWDEDGWVDLAGHRGPDTPRLRFNVGGNYSQTVVSTPDITMMDSGFGRIATLELSHFGRPGDRPIKLEILGVLFVNSVSNTLTESQMDLIFQNIGMFRDNGDGVFDQATDLELVGLAPLTPGNGSFSLTIDAIDGTELFSAPSGSTPEPVTLFLVADLEATAASTLSQFRVTMNAFLVNSSASDPDGGELAVHQPPAVYQTVFIESGSLFADGFESGNTSAWSTAVP